MSPPGRAVRGLRRGRVLAVQRGLVVEPFNDDGLRVGCAGAGAVRAPAGPEERADSPLGSRLAVPLGPLQRTLERGRHPRRRRAATATTTRRPRRSTGCTRPSRSTGAPWKTCEAVEIATLEWMSWLTERQGTALIEQFSAPMAASASRRHPARRRLRRFSPGHPAATASPQSAPQTPATPTHADSARSRAAAGGRRRDF